MIGNSDSLILEFGRLRDYQQPLLPGEADLASGATLARLWELRAGRTAARTALSRLSIPEAPILCDSAGAPLWPSDLCGSLSHTPTHVAALVARKERWRAVGIDVNDGRALGAHLSAQVMSKVEEQLLSPLAERLCVDPANLAFSAKEALYKCQYPITGNVNVSFNDVTLRRGTHAQFSAEMAQWGISAELQFASLDAKLVCCCTIPAHQVC